MFRSIIKQKWTLGHSVNDQDLGQRGRLLREGKRQEGMEFERGTPEFASKAADKGVIQIVSVREAELGNLEI